MDRPSENAMSPDYRPLPVENLPRRPSLGSPRGGWLRRRRFLIAALLLAAALGYLGFIAFRSASMYYLTVGELLERGEAAYGEHLRVTGWVVEGSVERDAATNTLRFQMKDKEGTAAVPVVYQGVVPDAFREGGEVIVEGKLTPGEVFEATTLLAKCPSKYEAAESGGEGEQP